MTSLVESGSRDVLVIARLDRLLVGLDRVHVEVDEVLHCPDRPDPRPDAGHGIHRLVLTPGGRLVSRSTRPAPPAAGACSAFPGGRRRCSRSAVPASGSCTRPRGPACPASAAPPASRGRLTRAPAG